MNGYVLSRYVVNASDPSDEPRLVREEEFVGLGQAREAAHAWVAGRGHRRAILVHEVSGREEEWESPDLVHYNDPLPEGGSS